MKTSPRYFLNTNVCLHVLIFTFSPLLIVASSATTEAKALLRWKNSLSSFDDPLGSWSLNNTRNHCRWTGIRCNTGGSVSEIDLSHLNLTGTIDKLSFTSLPNLTTFNLSSNYFNGSTPSSISHLSRLIFLDISNNYLEDNIPPEIGNLTELQYLNFYNNCFSGPVPSSIGNLSKLTFLDLSNNYLEDNIPSEIGNLTKVQYLSFYNNNFTGIIPYQIGNLQQVRYMDFGANFFETPDWSRIPSFPLLTYLSFSQNELTLGFPDFIPLCLNLTFLNLASNNLIGQIPDSVFNNLVRLEYLYLSLNSFQGPLSANLTNLSNLRHLDLGGNKIEDSFPFWSENLPELRIMVLKSNKFYGTIPSTKAKHPFPKLQVLDISNNELTGILPINYFKNFKAMMDLQENDTETIHMYRQTTKLVVKGQEYYYVRILSTFTTIDLSCNKFHGNIPLSLGNLNSLRYLNLSHNILSGHIPASLGWIAKLESLDLSSNKLTGEIPWQLTNLTFLEVLNFSYNFLVGPIPQPVHQFATFDSSSYVGNSGLCGFPLENKCKANKVQQEIMDEDNGILDGLTWQLFVLVGYGCGTLFGIVLCHLIFLYERPKWFVESVLDAFRKIMPAGNDKVGFRMVVLRD